MGAKQKAGVVAAGVGLGLLAAYAFGRKAEAMPKKRILIPGGESRVIALAVKYGKVFNVPASLIIALVKIESDNIANAVNLKNARGGAWGYSQITLDTAKDLTKRFPAVAKKYWPKFDGTGESLLEPETNIAMAAFYLSLLWKRYLKKPGNWLTAGLAWHQGSGNIDKQIATGKGKVVISNLPPKGKEFYARLQKQIAGNPVVAKAITNEQTSGKFAYA